MAWSPAESSWAAMWWKAATTRTSGPEDLLGLLRRRALRRRREEPAAAEGERDHRADHHLAATGLAQLGQRGREPGGRHREHDDLRGRGRVAIGLAVDPAAGSRWQLGGLAAGALRVARPDDHLVPGLGPPEPEPHAFLAGTADDADPHALSLSLDYRNRSRAGIAQQGAARAVAARPVEPADDGHRHPVELAHDRLGGAGQLVGQGQDGGLEHVAGRIALAEIADDRLEARRGRPRR